MAQIVLRRFRPPPLVVLRRFGPDGRLAALAERAQGEPLPMVVAVVEGGSVRYQHSQAPLSPSWIINHNLGVWPVSVTVLSVGGVEIDADVTHVSINQTIINFSAPTAGVARII